MKVVKPAKVPVLHRVVEIMRRPYLHVAATIAFPLGEPRALLDELAFWSLVAGELGDRVFDEAAAKKQGEILVCGSFFAPQGSPLTASYVRASVGAIDKRLAVVGPRYWQGGVPTEPLPVTTLPIDWAHAFGGPSHGRNPYGRGIAEAQIDGEMRVPLPCVEHYGALVRSPSERPDPAGFLPMDPTFAQRRELAGTYDKRWLETDFPGMPGDMSLDFFNAAPKDQWCEGFFAGDEAFVVENMNAEEPRLEGRLGGLVARVFVTHRTPGGERFRELTMRCDTVWLFPSVKAGAVVFHGALPIHSDDAADIVHLVCACEDPAFPRTVEHYQGALARRLDKDKAAIAEISDRDLMPARESGVAPNIGETDVGRWVRSEGLAYKNARRGQERDFAEARAKLIAEGKDPAVFGLTELPPEPEIPPTHDLDAMADYMERQSAQAQVDTEMADLDAKVKEAEEEARRLYAKAGRDYDAEKRDAEKKSAGPPTFSMAETFQKLDAQQAKARDLEKPIDELERAWDPAHRAQLLEQEGALHDLYRKGAHLQSTAPKMDPEASARCRALVELAKVSGDSLAGRDFTGADLSGLSLSGMDLSGALLEAADLSGSDLSVANLEGAVLAKVEARGANLMGARLAEANLGGAVLEGANLERANLEQAILSRAKLGGARLSGANLKDAEWFETELGAADFTDAEIGAGFFMKIDLGKTRFDGADLSHAGFVECTMDGASFARAKLHKASFVSCKGESVSFREASFGEGVVVHGSSLPGADFRGADMEKVNLRGTPVTGARFEGANLAGADLSECDAGSARFEEAVLRGAMLVRTNLAEASLQRADLTNAMASKALLMGADFTGSNLFQADLSRVVGDARTTFAGALVTRVRTLPKADTAPADETDPP